MTGVAASNDVLMAHLRTMYGPEAEFRPGQREAIEAIVRDSQRVLVVQRTGWGKSLVYWLSTRVRRDAGHGPTLLISPLLALMRNQIEMAARLGVRAVSMNSTNLVDWTTIEEALARDAIDVLLVSPERLANEDFVGRILPSIQGSIGMFVVDEAHCISDWGHDFRPDYRRINRILRLLSPTVPVLATTATANDRVVADIAAQLGEGAIVLRGPLARATLHLDAIELADQAERLAWLAVNVPGLPGSGIVYCLTRADVERVAAWLSSQGISAAAYHAGLDNAEREALESALLANELKALVATVALAMGFDKPDLGFVIHYQRPGSPIAYYQQVGRAGRAVERAYGVLLSGREDDEIADYFIESAFPPTVHMEAILDALGKATSLTVRGLERRVNLPQGQIAKALKLLEIDGAVAHERGRYFRTANPWRQDEERIAGIKAIRHAELAQMRAYMTHDGCLMEYLTRLLDDPAPAVCGRCSVDVGRGFPREVDPDLTRAAVRFLRRDRRAIEPRMRWADQGNAGPVIQPPNERGIALCVYGDAGWGRAVKNGKYVDGRFSDDLVAAAAEAINEPRGTAPAPTWVTAIPSRSRSGVVGDFAARLATALGLEFRECLTIRVDGQPQKSMLNSMQQQRNAQYNLDINGSAVLNGPVLLVDDIVDSRWTMTVAGWLLRTHGSGPVHPFVLAVASTRDT